MESTKLDTKLCNVMKMMICFPSFGRYIGLMFYLARARQLQVGCFWRRVERKAEKTERAE
jgi:hypothetical protein